MKRFYFYVALILVLLWASLLWAKPMVKVVPKEASTAEAQAGTETALRSYSPAKIKAAIDALAAVGTEITPQTFGFSECLDSAPDTALTKSACADNSNWVIDAALGAVDLLVVYGATGWKALYDFTNNSRVQNPNQEIQALSVTSDFIYYDTQALSVTTEADITLTSSVVLITGDDDGDNDSIDLQDGSEGQQVTFIAVSAVDATDTITIAMTDTVCTNCPAVVFSTIGENATLLWTGSTWVVTSLPDSLD